MAIDYRIENRGRYLLVTCTGAFAGAGLLDVHAQAFAQAAAEGSMAILVDTTGLEAFAPTPLARFDFAAALAKLQREQGQRIHVAFVGKPPIVDPDRFGETVALNRGASCGVFESITDAERWIDELAQTRPC